ncbi:MAG: cyclase family protein [Blastocatellia bacterium]|nr:cyclase family protein [Blastocatellia bacterium]
MKIYDVTIAVSEIVPTFPGDPKVKIDVCAALANGDVANVSQICFGVHTATHVDAPNHFIEGTRRVDELDLYKLIGDCRVVELDKNVMAITAQHVETLENVERVLFKTRNSQFWNEPEKGFREDFTYIEPEAARVLVEKGIKLVGIDYLSVEQFGAKSFDTHITLLEKEVVIIEGLDLREVPAGDYELFCLPLKIVGGTGDGAPARTVLRRDEG